MSASTPDLLTPEEVAAVHAALVGAPVGAPPEGCAAAVEAARAYALGDGLDLFECTDLFEVAARLLIALLARPPFAARPRATSLATTLALLHVNGIVVEAPADDLLAAVDLAVREDADLVEVAWALRQRARAW